MGRIMLLVSDFVLSFMWVCSGVLIKIGASKYLWFISSEPLREMLKIGIVIANLFFFTFLRIITRGGAYNPLTVLATAISGDFSKFLYCVAARIPVQVIGSIIGVRLMIDTFPEVGRGPRLNIDIHRGALIEGILAFAIVSLSLRLGTKISEGFFMKTWISCVFKLALHVLGSDLTGGCMNPASVMGWAFARGDHMTREHFVVYWLAPMEGTVLAVWTFKLLVQPVKEDKSVTKSKVQ